MMITSSAFNAAQVKNRPQATTSHVNHAPGTLFKGAPAKDQYTGAKVYPFSTVLKLREEGKPDLADELVTTMRKNDHSDTPEEAKVGFLTLQQWSDWGKKLRLFPQKDEEPTRPAKRNVEEIEPEMPDEKRTLRSQAPKAKPISKRDFTTAFPPEGAEKGSQDEASKPTGKRNRARTFTQSM